MLQKYEKWLWIELIGFDVDAPDFGVGAYLEKLGFVPNGLSLLIATANFIHMHDENWANRTFPPEYCSYGAHNVNGERQRQVWTGARLKQLIEELHRHRIPVAFGVFSVYWENLEWLEQHPEVLYITEDGKECSCVCALKRLKDGSFYEDFFVGKLAKIMRDYNFDGFHAADGFAHPSLPIFKGDFSNDMIEQFVDFSRIEIPPSTFSPTENNEFQTCRIAKWILKNHPLQWRRFYVQRSTQFWAKTAKLLKSMNKWMIFNSAWTRDPFEAIYRYGIDYRALSETGVEKYIVELAGAVLELENWGPQEPRTVYSRMASTLLLRGYVPESKLVFLNGIKDFKEEFLLLQHAPALYESEVISQYNLFCRTKNNELMRCQDGALACLADGLRKEEWEKINNTWDFSSEFRAEAVGGAVLLYSGRHIYGQLEYYMKHRCWYDYRLLTHLLSNGAPIYTVSDIENIHGLKQTLVVLNPELWTEDELKQIASYCGAPVICIGHDAKKLPFRFDAIINDGNRIYCGVFNCKDKKLLDDLSFKSKKRLTAALPRNIVDPHTWLKDLYVTRIAKDFLPTCAKLITGCSHNPKIQCVPAETKIEILKKGDIYRLIIWNDHNHYSHVTIKTDSPVKKVEYVSGFKFCEILVENNMFRLKLPPLGIVIAELSF